jgi:hypothetical protein
MKARYHRQITLEALQDRFDRPFLEAVVSANLSQDRPAGQLGHPHFHFDDSAFEAGNQYMESQRAIILETVAKDDNPLLASAAFGRLTHAAQDFYAHSNYVALWLAHIPEPARSDPEQIDPVYQSIMNSKDLYSGKIYLPWVLFTYIPVFGKAVKALIPRDSHTWMNLDSPTEGHLFPYALSAARKRTVIEYEKIVEQIAMRSRQQAVYRFTGLERRM